MTHHQTDNGTSQANNPTSHLNFNLGRRDSDPNTGHDPNALQNRPPAFRPTNRNSRSGIRGWRKRRPEKVRSVHFEGRDSLHDSEYGRGFPLWSTSPTPATSRPIGVPHPMPYYNAPVNQPPEWASSSDLQPSEAIYYDEPHQGSPSIYNHPFTDRGSVLNLARSLHDIMLLGFPLLYHRRLARVREKADLPQPVITWVKNPAASYPFLSHRKRMLSVPHEGIQHAALGGHSQGTRVQWDVFQAEWESFVFASTQEWQTLNIISALLLRYVSLVTDPLYRASVQSC
jgi:hypothetical protein